MSETAKAYRFGEAPKRIELRGDKTTATESAQHIITFPGGAIELARVGDVEYWVHVTVNRREQTNLADNRHAARGEVVESRIGRGRAGIEDLERLDSVEQIAVRIKSARGGA